MKTFFVQAEGKHRSFVQVQIYEGSPATSKESALKMKILVLDRSRAARRLEHMDSANMAFFLLPVRGHCGRFSNLSEGGVVLATESKEEANAILAHLARLTKHPAVSAVAAVA